MTMTAIGPISEDAAAQARLHRRDREELEALATKFVGGAAPAVAATSRMPLIGAALAGTAAFAVLTWALWPEPPAQQARAAVTAASEVAGWQKGFEERRERRRKELESGAEYMSRVAASDAELMKELSERAGALARRADAAAAPKQVAKAEPKVVAKGEPTPRAGAAHPAPEPSSPPVMVASAAPAAAVAEPAPAPNAAPQAAPAATPAQVASASCSIHVADLSASGKLTYEAISHMQGVRIDANGHVFTPPVPVDGRPMVFEVMPDGCVKVVRSAR